jgi:hypothetical protein
MHRLDCIQRHAHQCSAHEVRCVDVTFPIGIHIPIGVVPAVLVRTPGNRQIGFALHRVSADELAAGGVVVACPCIQQASFWVCVVAAKVVGVAAYCCAGVAAGLSVDSAIGVVVQQAVCFGCACFADNGGYQVAVGVCVQLGGGASELGYATSEISNVMGLKMAPKSGIIALLAS